ncbi:IucC family-domain-containing protein [Coemansia spiralis]|nr:IucC family-domain-containing protein [Coemansia spiralis]
MRLVGKWNSYSSAAVDNICCELASSIENQAYAYKNRPPAPSVAFSTAIEWEQSIVEGHATHPMHRARYAVPPLEHIAPDTDFFHLRLAFIAVPRSEVRIEGNLEELLDPLYGNTDMDSADKQGSQYILDYVDRSVEIVLPVHPLHLPAVQAMFAFARVLPFSVPAEAQASLRTVRPSAFMPLGYNIKLPLGIKVSSSLRTITPWSTYVGPRITKVIPMLLRGMATGEPLLIAGEPASAVSTSPDFDIAKYLSCVIREDPEFICRSRGERVILAAALTTYDDSGTSTIVQQWNLDTQEKRRAFLQAYAEKLFDAFLPPIINHGFAFEAHPQNSLLRIDAETGEIRGFIVRDFGGIKVHRETFKQSSGIYIDMLPNSCTDAQSMYEVYDLAYHTLVQCQLHRLVRALKLHYKGNGWAIVRKAFEQRVPESHSLRSTWYQESFDLKCFVTMKVDGLYRDYIYRKVPNVLFYENEEKGILFPPVDTI